MRIAVCDDVKCERQRVIEALNSIVPYYSIEEFHNGKDLLESHLLQPFDLIFLDILMPGINGIETAAVLRKNDAQTPIVFLSASEEFGIQSYRVHAFDYLVKPIEEEQLRDCIMRLPPQQAKDKDYITVTYAGIETQILLKNIQCLESNLRKVVFTLVGNREIEIIGKLTDFAPFLLSRGFCRCHKSYLINIEYIDRIKEDMFHLSGGKRIKISRAYLKSAKKAYFDYIFNSNVGE